MNSLFGHKQQPNLLLVSTHSMMNRVFYMEITWSIGSMHGILFQTEYDGVHQTLAKIGWLKLPQEEIEKLKKLRGLETECSGTVHSLQNS